MKSGIKYLIYLLALLITYGCASISSTKPSDSFSEDLSVYRLTFNETNVSSTGEVPEEQVKSPEETQFEVTGEFNPTMDVTYELDSLLDSLAVYNQKKKTFQGYTIQVYTGTSSEEANEVRADLYRVLPDTRSKISYEIPNYKVKIGKFYTRLEAEDIFSKVRREFKEAILVPEEFPIDDH